MSYTLSLHDALPIYVNERTRAPIPAIIVASIIVAGILAWSVLSSSFFTLLSMGVLAGVITILTVSVSAIAFPFRRPDLFRNSRSEEHTSELQSPVHVLHSFPTRRSSDLCERAHACSHPGDHCCFDHRSRHPGMVGALQLLLYAALYGGTGRSHYNSHCECVCNCIPFPPPRPVQELEIGRAHV